jgi:chlorophyll synthase
MWAFACGAVASGVPIADHWWMLALGMMLAGPLVCATSQAVNDWFDRHVDAINEPSRPIPSGRMPGRWGLGIAIAWTLLSLAVSTALGLWGFLATVLGLALAWAYSAPPLRLKRNGWWGNSACALSYEGIAWFTGSAVMLGGMLPAMPSIVLALLFSFGAHGIMTLNDFKAVQGDLKSGIRSLPAQLGIERAAKVACWMMALAQVAVVGVLVVWNQHGYAMGVSALLAIQILLMRKLLASPRERAPWYNGTGITLYVSAMMISAFAVRGL